MAITTQSLWSNVRFKNAAVDQHTYPESCRALRGFASLRTPDAGRVHLDVESVLRINNYTWGAQGKAVRKFVWQLDTTPKAGDTGTIWERIRSKFSFWSNGLRLCSPEGTYVSIQGQGGANARITGVSAPKDLVLGALVFNGGSAPCISVHKTGPTGEIQVLFADDVEIPYAEGKFKIRGEHSSRGHVYERVCFHPNGSVRYAALAWIQDANQGRVNSVCLKLSNREKTAYQFVTAARITLDELGRITSGTIVRSNNYDQEIQSHIVVTYKEDGSTLIS